MSLFLHMRLTPVHPKILFFKNQEMTYVFVDLVTIALFGGQ
jgi:hypothetical protein